MAFFGQIKAAHLPTEKHTASSLMLLAAGTTGPTSANLFEAMESTESHMSKPEAAVWQAATFWRRKGSGVTEMVLHFRKVLQAAT